MLLADKPFQLVKIPSNPSRRALVSLTRGAAALRDAGFPVELVIGPIVVDDKDPPAWAVALRKQCEDAIHEFRRRRRKEHARRTLEALSTPGKTDEEEIDTLLESVYRAHEAGEPSEDLLDTFLDTFESFLTPQGVEKADLVFDRVELDRAPDATGILLLATTRLTRAHFKRREPFLARLERWFTGRDGRRPEDVERMLRGLRE
jgi:hypothetical protein